MEYVNFKNITLDDNFTEKVVGKLINCKTLEKDLDYVEELSKDAIEHYISNEFGQLNLSKLNRVFSYVWTISKYLNVYGKIHTRLSDEQSEIIIAGMNRMESLIDTLREDQGLRTKIDARLSQHAGDRVIAWRDFCNDVNHKNGDIAEYKKHMDIINDETDNYYSNKAQIVDAESSYVFISDRNKSLLAGLTREGLVNGKHNAQKKNKKGYLYYLEENSVNYLLTVAENPKFRELVYNKLVTGSQYRKDNVLVLNKILKSKAQIAHIMGSNTYVDLVAKKHTLNTSAKISKFLNDVKKENKDAFDSVLNKVYELAGTKDIKPYDYLYYFDKAIKAKEEDPSAKFYFEFDNTLENIFKDISQKFKINITKTESTQYASIFKFSDEKLKKEALLIINRYNPYEANSYQLDIVRQDNKDLSFVGASFIQLENANNYSRKNLMSFQDVTILHHELGHFLHSFYGNGDFVFDRHKLELDLVEVPSQFMEFRCKDYSYMRKISSHIKTGEKIPKSLFDSIVENYCANDSINVYIEAVKNEKLKDLFEIGKITPTMRKSLLDEMLSHNVCYDISDDLFMSYADHGFDYGPIGYIYNFALKNAEELYNNKRTSLKNTFVNTFNKNAAFLTLGADSIAHKIATEHINSKSTSNTKVRPR